MNIEHDKMPAKKHDLAVSTLDVIDVIRLISNDAQFDGAKLTPKALLASKVLLQTAMLHGISKHHLLRLLKACKETVSEQFVLWSEGEMPITGFDLMG